LEFCKKFNPDYNEVLNGEILDIAVRQSKNRSLRVCNHIVITESELSKIRSVKNYRYEKILFVMLVMSKALKPNYTSKDGKSYLNENFGDVLRFAKVSAGKIEKIRIKNDLFKLGMIDAIFPDSRSVCNGRDNFLLKYRDDNSPIAIDVDNILEMINAYPYFCSACGKTMIRRNNRQTTCDNCYKEKRRKDVKNNVKKFRNKDVII
jgi:hypothetical protein